jgi:hypothetical protein
MQTMTFQVRVGADGILRLEVPTGMTEVEVDVVVTFHPRRNGVEMLTPEDPGWLVGFIDQIFGGWQGEPLERAPQGEYEVRRSFE